MDNRWATRGPRVRRAGLGAAAVEDRQRVRRPGHLVAAPARLTARVAWYAAGPVGEYEWRTAAHGGPAAAVAAGRRLAETLRELGAVPRITRARAVAGGVTAWERSAAAQVPGWAPDPLP
ncbi:hypothetical protein ACGF1Z_05780 [Streptomyces sp. NPDC048018]|uniref:hypothetical protein n=1 Tax=Streptomyces sp. NPDC048018 TaxID=3365499 RepID=UPI0037179C94